MMNNTNGLQDLPEGWVWATIGNLVGDDGVFIDGDWVESKDQDPNGDVRLIQLADVGDGVYRNRSDRYLTSAKATELGCTFLEAGDVLIARMPDPLGRACIFPGDSKPCVTVVDVCIVRTGSTNINHHWLMNFINAPTFRAEIASLQSGSTRKRISRSNLAKLELPIPPLSEQQRIVTEIEKQFTRLDVGVAALKRAQANLKRYKAAVLKAACEGKLVEQDPSDEPASELLKRILTERQAKWEADLRTKGKDPKKAKDEEPQASDLDELPELPSGWCWATLASLILQGPQNGVYLPKSLYGGGVPILRIDDYQNGWSRASEELNLVNAEAPDVEKYSLHENDLIVNRVNSMTHLGKCMVVASRNLPAIFESNMMRIRLADFCSPKFVEGYLQSVAGRTRLTSNAKWAVNQASINQTDVGNTPVPLPPLAEQRRIVAEVERRLSVVQELEGTLTANLARAERLRQSILKRAFEGKLVPQVAREEIPQ